MSRDTTTGLRFEKDTDLFTFLLNDYELVKTDTYKKDGNTYLNLKGRKFYAYLTKKGIDYTKLVSRILLPDECVYSEKTNTLYVFEKKFQQTAGSADEKLQTCDFKKKQYIKLFSELNYKVEFMYILSDWFRQECYKDTRDYIISVGCSYYYNYIPLHELGLPVPPVDEND